MTTQELGNGLKACSGCGRWLDRAAFPPNLELTSGLSSWCRACHLEATRRWRAEHPEAVAASNARRRLEPYPPRECATCGETFTPRRHDGRYCTPACTCRARRSRRRTAGDTQPTTIL
jgi:hypothetical protein